MNILVKNVPENLNISKEINFGYLLEILSENFFDIDFKEVKKEDISQSMVDNLKEMEKELYKNGLKNFTSISS